MRVSVTPLGARAGSLRAAATAAVDYVCAPDPSANLLGTIRSDIGSPVAYYADASVEGPGRWLGTGGELLGVAGTVVREDLGALLAGEHPRLGQPLLSARGSATRARQRATTSEAPSLGGDPDGRLTLTQLAQLSGLDSRYLRRLARHTQEDRQRAPDAPANRPPSRSRPRAHLNAERDDNGRWTLTRREALRFLSARKPPTALIGYDVTFSVPKSVSILWAAGQPAERDAIVAAVHHAVDTGLAYLEDSGCRVGRGANRQTGRGFTAAAFTHATSRNLDPQLHEHVIIANVAHTGDGQARALDGTALFAHAKTAAHLAGAALRHELTRDLGVAWGPVHNGAAEITGVPRRVIDAMSSRRAEIASLAHELGVPSARVRQIAALRTRGPKPTIDTAALRPGWLDRLDAAGFDATAHAACLARQPELLLVTETDRARLFRTLARHDGLTRHGATFDRRDVLQAVADWGNERLTTRDIHTLTDEFLGSGHAIPLAARADWRPRDLIRRRDGHTIPAAPELRIYSTATMLRAEQHVLDAFTAGLDRHRTAIPAEILDAATAAQQPALGTDQQHFVRSLCTTRNQLQCAVGPAGTGKTYALATAARAWTTAGYQVRGLAVQGTAAETLGRDTGIDTETVAAFLTRHDHSPTPLLDSKSVVIVDEASTLSTIDFSRLVTAVVHAHARAVFVGDPAQHSAVAAGGAFRVLTARHARRTPSLNINRRQAAPQLAAVRAALNELRAGKPADALAHLEADGRIEETDDAPHALDALTGDWYQDRLTRRVDPSRAVSCMIAEHHYARRQLIERARTILHEVGDLHGPTLRVASQDFQAGDEIICRARASELHPPGQPDLYLRNGTLGIVTTVRPATAEDAGGLIVDFAHRGLIDVPASELEREIRPGLRGVLTHAYALTSHAAQSATFETARALVTDATSRAALYVAATRGRTDLRLYLVSQHHLTDDDLPELPHHDDGHTTRDVLAARLGADRAETLATVIDPEATELLAALRTHDLAALHDAARHEPPDSLTADLLRRARDVLATTIATGAVARPTPDVIAHLGDRPDRPQQARAAWDRAVGAIAVYRAQHRVPAPRADSPDWPIGLRPAGEAAQHHDQIHGHTRDALVQQAARQPTRELADQRDELMRALGTRPADPANLRRRLQADLEHALDHRTRCDAAHAQSVRQLETPGRRTVKRDGQATENARRRVTETAASRERARAHVSRLELRLAALDRDEPSILTLRDHLAIIDAALETQINNAVARHKATPADYILGVLGPRPIDRERTEQWDEQARSTERHRHYRGVAPIVSDERTAIQAPTDIQPANRYMVVHATGAARLEAHHIEADSRNI